MRAFLSLVPLPGICLDIEHWRGQCWPTLAKPVPVQNFHLTLVFLGNVTPDQFNQLLEGIDGIEWSKFQLTLDQVGYWPKPDVLWLGPTEASSEVSALAKRCKRIANRVGIKVDSTRFSPHITLARRLIQPPPAALIEPDFSLELDRMSLIESTLQPGGAQYREVASWSPS